MITKVWLKETREDSPLCYPDCYPTVVEHLKSLVYIMDRNKNHSKAEAVYTIEHILRLEFRPD